MWRNMTGKKFPPLSLSLQKLPYAGHENRQFSMIKLGMKIARIEMLDGNMVISPEYES
tara:strand:+ start:457 stop:630 length:174 start_codon:yes stop_codon:yes gene_type:complete